MTFSKRLSLALLWAALPVALQGQSNDRSVAITRFIVTPSFDGQIDEAAWSEIPVIDLTTYRPTAGLPPADSSAIRIGYDDEYLWFAGEFFVSDESQIQVTSLTRDRQVADDEFRVMLDTFDDDQSAVFFAVNPAGNRVDGTVSDDGATSSSDWNTFWDARTTRNSSGWSVEVRIPWSSLRFQSSDDVVRMGAIITRFSAASSAFDSWPSLDPRFGNAQRRPSLAQTITLRGVRGRNPIYLTPYLLGGGQREAKPPASGEPTGFDRDGTTEAGFDLKTALFSNLTLDLTANTDFAQVEADNEQVNLTRFSLFFPEKRSFFQERAGVFGVATGSMGDQSLFFHSRRIGLDRGGNPLRIYGGGRLVGRLGDWDVGVMSLQAEADQFSGSGSENFSIVRATRRVLNDQSTFGGILTTRLGDSTSRNVSWGLDSRLRAIGDNYLAVQVGQTTTGADLMDATDRAMARVVIERPSTLQSSGFGYQAGLKWSGEGFDPGIGFQPRNDYSHAFANIRYGLFPSGPLRVLQPSVAVQSFHRNSDGKLESGFRALFLNYAFKSGVNGWAGVTRRSELLDDELQLGPDAVIPVGEHEFTAFQVAVFPAAGSKLRVGVTAEAGQFYDGTARSLFVGLNWAPTAHLLIGGDYTRERISFDSRSQVIDPDLARMRLELALNRKFSANLFVQYNRLGRNISSNIRLRYQFAEGQDLYLVLNERLNTDLTRFGTDLSALPRSQSRALLIKYSHTLTW